METKPVHPLDKLQHAYEPAENSPSGKMGYRCKLCGHYTNAPSKGRFSPCPQKAEMEEVCTLPGGYTLFRQYNKAGGFTYWSDEIGGGVMVWDTCLVSQSTLLFAMAEEDRRYFHERTADQ